ncbi:FecR domain-containing protein [Butyricimonas virosa]|uniref:FecR domain-containing protein n=1 Tax=Butyricimonas virosa TaxID=544645 RepID=UPI003AAE64A8
MKNTEFDIDEKILQVLNEVSTPSEKAFLDQWISASAEHEQYYRERIKEFRKIKIAANRSDAEEIKRRVKLNLEYNRIRRLQIKRRRIGWRIGVAMAAAVILVIGINFSSSLHQEKHLGSVPFASTVISSGKRVAIITLANGEQLELGNGDPKVHEENGALLKMDSSVITYQSLQTENNEIAYNTLSVPLGGEYQIILSDSTKVWVNADSKLKYPIAFRSERREVFLEGEAYFEVKKDRQHPFIVHTSRGSVKVLGTGFNVRDYQEEAKVVTTLVEGKVAYSRTVQSDEVVLVPGYQLEDNGIAELIPRQVDVEMYVGWKDGKYIFDDATLEEIMQVLSRWYDVTVFYKSEKSKDLHFTGDLERYENINDFLHFMELGGKVTFNIQGKTIIIE